MRNSASSTFVIEVNLSTSTPWVLDGRGSHFCINVQGLLYNRSLAKGEVDISVGNGARIVPLAIGSYSLTLPVGLVLELESCFYVSYHY